MTISTQTFIAVNIGSSANDGTGDNIRAAFSKLNSNFSNISDIGFDAGNIVASGEVQIGGNLITEGGRIEAGYQYSTPTTGFTITAGVGVSRVIIDPAGTLANGIFQLPAANVDAYVVSFSSTQTVTAFRTLPSTGTTLVPSANVTLTAGTQVSYFYHLDETRWYKIA